MSITTLYAELIVAGTGAMIFILLFFYSCFGDQTWFAKLQGLSSLGSGTATLFLVPALSLIYLLGIVVTNVGHILFDWVEKKLRNSKLGEGYEQARNKLYLSDKTEFIEDFKFRRSKVRICRGWFINSFLIILALVGSLGAGKIQSSTAWFWIITIALLMVGTLVSWWTATTTELKWLCSYRKEIEGGSLEKAPSPWVFLWYS